MESKKSNLEFERCNVFLIFNSSLPMELGESLKKRCVGGEGMNQRWKLAFNSHIPTYVLGQWINKYFGEETESSSLDNEAVESLQILFNI